MITYAQLKGKPRDFLAATGLTDAEFQYVLPTFSRLYAARTSAELTLAGKPRQRKPGAGAKGTLRNVEDKLLFILVYEKTYPLQTMLGLQFEMSQAQANYWIHQLLPILKQSLTELGLAPKRDPQEVSKAAISGETSSNLLLDGTERRRQRPKDAEKQTAHYSGKKKAHTDKNVLLVDEQTNKVVYLSPTEPGRVHDKKIADMHPIAYPPAATLSKDTGFQGYEPSDALSYQPKKSPKARN
jgi:hypothetical protein